jgi:hypothetical protein
MELKVQLLQKMRPQMRQWWRRTNTLNGVSHS